MLQLSRTVFFFFPLLFCFALTKLVGYYWQRKGDHNSVCALVPIFFFQYLPLAYSKRAYQKKTKYGLMKYSFSCIIRRRGSITRSFFSIDSICIFFLNQDVTNIFFLSFPSFLVFRLLRMLLSIQEILI